MTAGAAEKSKMSRSEITRHAALVRWSRVPASKRSEAAERLSKLGMIAQKNCEHPEDRREIACSFCTRTLARMSGGEMVRVKLAAFRKSDSTLPQVIARAECRHPKKKLRTICGFCRKPIEA